MRLNLSFPIINGALTDILWRAQIGKPVTFEPFELQKWQSTKNGSTLQKKPFDTVTVTVELSKNETITVKIG